MKKGFIVGFALFVACSSIFLVIGISCDKPDPSILLLDAAEGEDLAAIKSSLHQGADINKPSKIKWGWTPLIAACVHFDNDTNVIQFLVESGADVNLADQNGKTPLIWLTFKGDKAVPTVKYLIAHGAKLDAKDNLGATVFDYAKSDPPTPQLLECLKAARLEQENRPKK